MALKKKKEKSYKLLQELELLENSHWSENKCVYFPNKNCHSLNKFLCERCL